MCMCSAIMDTRRDLYAEGSVIEKPSYRGYDETRAVTREELVDLVEHARLTPSSVNKQALKYYLACEREKTNQIQPLTAWAKALKKEVPYEGNGVNLRILR